MEHDFFKRYIQEHKDAFEDEALPPNMLGNILDNLREREDRQQAKKKRSLAYTWMAVACSLFIAVGAYLFISQERTTKIISTHKIIAHREKGLETPIIDNETPISKEKRTMLVSKRTYIPKKPVDQHAGIYVGLADNLSVANRLNAILKIASLGTLDNKLKTVLCNAFNNDENDNVRLAALDILSKYPNDKYIQQYLMNGLTTQKDPMVQMELVKVVSNNDNPETTDKLKAMADNPYTLDVVKDQVYYALLTKQ